MFPKNLLSTEKCFWGLCPRVPYLFPPMEGGLIKVKKYRKQEYVQRLLFFVNVQSSLHENVVFSVCARMFNAVSVISMMWNSISGLDGC